MLCLSTGSVAEQNPKFSSKNFAGAEGGLRRKNKKE